MERRKYPRFSATPQFKLKARIRRISEKTACFLTVDNVSLGGFSLQGDVKWINSFTVGEQLEVMLFKNHESLKIIIEIVSSLKANETQVKFGTKIIGIDEKSRKTLCDFIERIQCEETSD